jgi:predicted NAD-dependent protein-ADP-ribosyltransferase YbiA (DUF1768 family)
MVIKFNKPEDGRFWLSNFWGEKQIKTLLPLEIDEQGRAVENSGYFTIDAIQGTPERPLNFPTAEHLFQSLKYAWTKPNWSRNRIRTQERAIIDIGRASSERVKSIGGIVINGAREIRKDWELNNGKQPYRLNAMKYVLRQKFSDPALRKKLLGTKDEFLAFDFTGRIDPGEYEENALWGIVNFIDGNTYEGENHLGRILMELREEFREEEGTRQERRERNGEGSSDSSHREEEGTNSFFIDEKLVEDYIRSLERNLLIRALYPEQQEQLMRINSTSNWLIFHASSLEKVSNYNEAGAEYRGDNYSIKSNELKMILECLTQQAGYRDFSAEQFLFRFDGDIVYDRVRGRLKKRRVGGFKGVIDGHLLPLVEDEETGNWSWGNRLGGERIIVYYLQPDGKFHDGEGNELQDTRSTKLKRW